MKTITTSLIIALIAVALAVACGAPSTRAPEPQTSGPLFGSDESFLTAQVAAVKKILEQEVGHD